jgi:hypothetical protein
MVEGSLNGLSSFILVAVVGIAVGKRPKCAVYPSMQMCFLTHELIKKKPI